MDCQLVSGAVVEPELRQKNSTNAGSRAGLLQPLMGKITPAAFLASARRISVRPGVVVGIELRLIPVTQRYRIVFLLQLVGQLHAPRSESERFGSRWRLKRW